MCILSDAIVWRSNRQCDLLFCRSLEGSDSRIFWGAANPPLYILPISPPSHPPRSSSSGLIRTMAGGYQYSDLSSWSVTVLRSNTHTGSHTSSTQGFAVHTSSLYQRTYTVYFHGYHSESCDQSHDTTVIVM